jgi:hypothetical protein
MRRRLEVFSGGYGPCPASVCSAGFRVGGFRGNQVATGGPPPANKSRCHRRAGVTLKLLHLEYLERPPDGYRYTQFGEICAWLVPPKVRRYPLRKRR